MKSTIQMLSFAASAAALTTSSSATQNGCYYSVAGVGNFNYHMNTTTDLTTSIYTVQNNNAPFARRFDVTNIGYDSTSGAMTLVVPGAQTVGPISSAQLTTSYADILYGSVRTVAKISSVAGTTSSFTFYSNDTQEVDFAFITGNTNLVHLTNEQTSSSSAATSYTYAAPSDATTAFHEYRVDWIPGATMFYIDSVLIQTTTGNVPSTAGFWLWNNWSNGNSWAAGPPTADSTLEIQSINAYFNRTSVVTSGTCSSASVVAAVASKTTSASSSSIATSSSTVKSSSTSSAAASTVSSSSAKASSTSSSTTSSYASTATGPPVPAGQTALCNTYNGYVYTDPTTGDNFMVACNTDFAGGDLSMVYVTSLAGCIQACASTKGCIDVTLSGAACYMKSTLTSGLAQTGMQGAYLLSY